MDVLSYASSQGHHFRLCTLAKRPRWLAVRTLYFRPWLKGYCRLAPKGAIDQMDQLRDWIQRFLVPHVADANPVDVGCEAELTANRLLKGGWPSF